jgi:Ala-tRNA(Pro) deacylase
VIPSRPRRETDVSDGDLKGIVMQGKQLLEGYLRDNAVTFQVRSHPEVFTAQEVAGTEHVPGREVGKVVMVTSDDKVVMVVVTAPATVDLNKVALALGAKDARLAREEEFEALFPDCDTGAMPPFGNGTLFDVPVYVDRELAEQDTVAFSACTHTDTVHLAYSDFEKMVQPTVADFTE